MLSEGMLKIDVCCYLEENWPLDNGDLEKSHKLYRLVTYQQCSHWIFQILGKKKRRPFPVFIQAYKNALRRLYIHILNMPKHQNSNLLINGYLSNATTV
jgi:uncharacterized protein YbgA (DUF1722 family)